ncbi:HAD-superfamily hydrolase, subfamily IA, variant 3 [Solidesulfovibrio carbinoliphilus subsp. oakridgensis]|uniref:HAD-superfamily hydrolase, subfamily IA, variant 3 n=1 Tax=Solidesulfovibrio carbinoliphilus subsp. oakridgensis TaxID=694327 RepID=G7Q5N4_9BACT|nr:HAD family phosphatase [Solidesulfovibrio carbinoliphilus]EHJ49593.1 HAD-superfamily hydrolase, subfamily IA, variant 3 [Solidesulfovibrio carbinoliphilus subsp. oakridgensis]
MQAIGESGCRIGTVFFDFGGVLAEEGFREGLIAIAEEAGRDPAAIVPVAYEMAWSTGFVVGGCDEAGFWEAFRRATGIARSDADLTEAVLSRFTPRPFLFNVADAAREMGLGTAILSDQTEWLARLDARLGVFSHFDAVFNSCEHGVSKRDRAFFDLALAAMDARAGTSLFIDDAPRNTALAASLGFHTILYRDEASFFTELAAVCPPLGATHV